MSSIQIITTGDGSHSLLNTHLNETYHSRHGALQESAHVFIKSGLEFIDQEYSPEVINLLEIGFGTGLNALLTLRHVHEANHKVFYTALEAYPVNEDVWSQLNYCATMPMFKGSFIKIHQAAWNEQVEIHPAFYLIKREIALQQAVFQDDIFDLVFFDAFAPNKQPEMWEAGILKKIARWMKKSGVFVTYCAKGQLKRDLRDAGMVVESLPGPPGKREMVRAIKR